MKERKASGAMKQSGCCWCDAGFKALIIHGNILCFIESVGIVSMGRYQHCNQPHVEVCWPDILLTPGLSNQSLTHCAGETEGCQNNQGDMYRSVGKWCACCTAIEDLCSSGVM